MDERSKYLRSLVVRMVEGGGRGHIGPAFSLIEIMRVLYDDFLNFEPTNPQDKNRDRFILSKGHGCLALYSILADKNFFDKKLLETFCKTDSIFGGHPEIYKVPGVEATTGALGHGLSIASGIALALKLEKKTQKVVTVVGDGEINEGSIWEALLSISKHQLSNLLIIIDYNKMQSYSSTYEVLDLEPLKEKLESFNLAVKEVDGHDLDNIKETLLSFPFNKTKASCIISHSIKGKGYSEAENNASWHHKSNLSDEELAKLKNSFKTENI